MSASDYCRLCLTNEYEAFINIFDNKIELNIESIIFIHFQLQESKENKSKDLKSFCVALASSHFQLLPIKLSIIK